MCKYVNFKTFGALKFFFVKINKLSCITQVRVRAYASVELELSICKLVKFKLKHGYLRVSQARRL